MRTLDMNQRTLSICAAAAIVAGCGGSQPLIGMPGAPSQGARNAARAYVGGSRMRSTTSGDNLVYITMATTVGIYSFTGKSVGALKGVGGPEICSDTQGNVWVGYGGGSLLEYAHGGSAPIAQLYLPRYFYGESCAVDPTTGDIAVAEQSEGHGWNVAVFQDIYGTPEIYTNPSFAIQFMGYDNQGNLFISGQDDKKIKFAELPGGASGFSPLLVDENFKALGGLQWDGQYLALGDSEKHVVYQMSIANGQASTQSTTTFPTWRKLKAVVPFAIQDGVIVFRNSATNYGYFNFPQGGHPIHKLAISTAGGITISVPSSRLAPTRLPKPRRAPETRKSASWIQRGVSGGALLYTEGSSYGTGTFIYSYPKAKLVGRLDAEGGGLCSDGAGNIFLTSRNSVTEYAHGGTTPIQTLRVLGAEMYNCMVDPTTQNLAVTMSCPPCGYQNLVIFPHESGPASGYVTGNSAWTAGYDGNGNLLVSDSSSAALRELPEGSSSFLTVTLDKSIGNINQIQWDGDHVTLQNLGYPGYIYPIKVVGSTATVLKPTKFRAQIDWTSTSWIYDGTVVFALNTQDNPPNEIGIWKYPRGNYALKIIKKIPYGGVGFGAATVSAPPPGAKPRI